MRRNTAFPQFAQPLAGQSVLLTEDEGLGSSETERVLSEAGARVLISHNVYQATLIVGRHDLTAAVIDAELGGHTIACISALLSRPTVPFLFLMRTGERPADDWQHVPLARSADEAIVLLAVLAAGLPPQPHHT